MLKDVGMTVPQGRETSAVYMYMYMQQHREWGQYQQERGWEHATITCATPPGLRMSLFLHALIPCLAAYTCTCILRSSPMLLHTCTCTCTVYIYMYILHLFLYFVALSSLHLYISFNISFTLFTLTFSAISCWDFWFMIPCFASVLSASSLFILDV